jgi:hypothetical protein
MVLLPALALAAVLLLCRTPGSAFLPAAASMPQAAREPAQPTNLTVMAWNLENFFDTENDPKNPGDDEYLPSGWTRWTGEEYARKLSNLTAVIAGVRPDILCLSEVENREVLTDLAASLRLKAGLDYPYLLHREGPDKRGIDTAILSRFRPQGVRWISPVALQREVTIATFAPGGRVLHVLSNHWKSRWEGVEVTEPIRAREARAVRAEVNAILARDPRAAVLVAGDFNDDFDGPSVTGVLRALPQRSVVLADPGGLALYNLHADLAPEERGTLYYRKGKRWNSFDQMVVSAGMVRESGETAPWLAPPGSFRVARTPRQLNPDGTPKPYRRYKNRDTGRWEYRQGYSDHLPVVLDLSAGG